MGSPDQVKSGWRALDIAADDGWDNSGREIERKGGSGEDQAKKKVINKR